VHKSIAMRAIDITFLQLRENRFISNNGRLSSGVAWRFGGK